MFFKNKNKGQNKVLTHKVPILLNSSYLLISCTLWDIVSIFHNVLYTIFPLFLKAQCLHLAGLHKKTKAQLETNSSLTIFWAMFFFQQTDKSEKVMSNIIFRSMFAHWVLHDMWWNTRSGYQYFLTQFVYNERTDVRNQVEYHTCLHTQPFLSCACVLMKFLQQPVNRMCMSSIFACLYNLSIVFRTFCHKITSHHNKQVNGSIKKFKTNIVIT